MANVVAYVRYSTYNSELDSYSKVENLKFATLEELQDVNTEAYHSFFKFIKRSLITALMEEHSKAEVKIMVEQEANIFHLHEGREPFMKKGTDLATRYPFKQNSHMIKAVIKEFCEKYNIVER